MTDVVRLSVCLSSSHHHEQARPPAPTSSAPPWCEVPGRRHHHGQTPAARGPPHPSRGGYSVCPTHLQVQKEKKPDTLLPGVRPLFGEPCLSSVMSTVYAAVFFVHMIPAHPHEHTPKSLFAPRPSISSPDASRLLSPTLTSCPRYTTHGACPTRCLAQALTSRDHFTNTNTLDLSTYTI
jgi:hypothetical protein